MATIDAHVHVWTDDLAAYPLAPGYAVAEMKPPTFTPEELLAHCRPSGVERIVLVQMSYYGTDNSYMLDTMAFFPGIFGGIAVIDETAPDVTAEMDRLGALGVRGFRVQPRSGSFDTPGLHAMFAHAARTRQSLCCLMNPDALVSLDLMCSAYPDTLVVIDHLCRIGIGGTIEEPEVAALCALSAHPGVNVKISAFYALGSKRPPHDDLLPLIRRVYDAFPANALMWASDCPFQVQSETYEDGLAPLRDRFEFRCEEDREWLLGGTAEGLFF
jgi:predicted TIM-barrel fold metal-dependent hydrolase